jgi:hypothetical protein
VKTACVHDFSAKAVKGNIFNVKRGAFTTFLVVFTFFLLN